MALQTSGAISLNQIHTEAGGTSGTTVSINDADIRGLTAASGYTIPTSSGSTIDFGDFYGATAWTHVLTQGNYNSQYIGKFATVVGSISPTTWSGYSIYTFARLNINSTNNLWFYLTGTMAANIFSSLSFEATDGTVVSVDNADAYSGQAGSYRYWTWDSADFDTGHYAKMVSTFDGSGTINVVIS